MLVKVLKKTAQMVCDADANVDAAVGSRTA